MAEGHAHEGAVAPRRRTTGAVPRSWVRPAEDASDPVIDADPGPVIAIIVGLVVVLVVVAGIALLVRHAGGGGSEAARSSAPLPPSAASQASAGEPPTDAARTDDGARGPAPAANVDAPKVDAAGVDDAQARGADGAGGTHEPAGLPPLGELAPEDDDGVEPDPPPARPRD